MNINTLMHQQIDFIYECNHCHEDKKILKIKQFNLEGQKFLLAMQKNQYCIKCLDQYVRKNKS